MKKILGLVLIGFLCFILVGCASKSDDDNNSNNNDNKPASDNSKKGIDLTDNSIFFVVIDGVKYDVKTTLQDVLDNGYTVLNSVKSNLNKEVKANQAVWDLIGFKSGENTYFQVKLFNRSDKSSTWAKCTLYEINLHDIWHKNISIVGGLTFESSMEEIEKVFKDVPSRKTDDPNKGQTILSYRTTYADGKIGTAKGSFQFFFDESGNLKSIMMQSNR